MSTTEITNYSAHDTMKMFTSLLPSLVMRALDCMDCAADEPDEDHATAPVLNAKERLDAAWKMQTACALTGGLCPQSKN